MRTEQVWLTTLGAVALVALVAALLALVAARRALAEARALVADRPTSSGQSSAAQPVVPERVPDSVSTVAGSTAAGSTEAEESAYVITGMDDEAAEASLGASAVPGRIDGRLFVDIVARETVVKAASWTHGLRRALAPEVRNRIRFQVRQQSRQNRKDRKDEMREALRHYRARREEDAA